MTPCIVGGASMWMGWSYSVSETELLGPRDFDVHSLFGFGRVRFVSVAKRSSDGKLIELASELVQSQ